MATSLSDLQAISNNRCDCSHKAGQHARYVGNCDNCNCSKYNFSLTNTEKAEEMNGACVTNSVSGATPSHDLTIKPADNDRGSVVVGIVSHAFQGDDELCNGILGYDHTHPKYGMICYAKRHAPIHQSVTIPDSGLKDSGKRLTFGSGMVRDVDDTKPSFDLVIPEGIPYNELMLTRWAELLRKGAIKYARRNWEKADSKEELDRAKASAFRHFMQWFSGETDEDHAAAVFFNINEVETIKYKQRGNA